MNFRTSIALVTFALAATAPAVWLSGSASAAPSTPPDRTSNPSTFSFGESNPSTFSFGESNPSTVVGPIRR